jgi:hypothetical protein
VPKLKQLIAMAVVSGGLGLGAVGLASLAEGEVYDQTKLALVVRLR